MACNTSNGVRVAAAQRSSRRRDGHVAGRNARVFQDVKTVGAHLAQLSPATSVLQAEVALLV